MVKWYRIYFCTAMPAKSHVLKTQDHTIPSLLNHAKNPTQQKAPTEATLFAQR